MHSIFFLEQPKSELDRLTLEGSVSTTSRHTIRRTPLNEWSARLRGRHLHNKHKRLTSTTQKGFEPRSQTARPLGLALFLYVVEYRQCISDLLTTTLTWCNKLLVGFINNLFYSIFFYLPHCRYRVLLLHCITHSEKHTFGRTPLGEWSARRRGLYQYNTQQTSMPPAGFEPAIPAIERPQTSGSDPTDTAIGYKQ